MPSGKPSPAQLLYQTEVQHFAAALAGFNAQRHRDSDQWETATYRNQITKQEAAT